MSVFGRMQECALAVVLAAAAWAATPQVKVPLSFEPNVGQADASVKYLARGNGATLWLTQNAAVLGVSGKTATSDLKLRFEGGRRDAVIEPEERRAGISNYFIGADPSKWHPDVPQFARVRYRDVYPGIDVLFYGNPEQLEYDLVIKPGADPSRIRLLFEGAKELRANAAGDLVMRLNSAEVKLHKPVVRQGGRRVEGRYVVYGKRRAGFSLGDYDHSAGLVIDPILTYATLLGSDVGDQAYGVAVDHQGNIYVTGETSSPNFPTKNALNGTLSFTTNNPFHAFITKINPSASGAASVVYSTLYGSDGVDQGLAIAVDSSGNVVITGQTGSFTPTLPQMNAFETPPVKAETCGDGGATCLSAFVMKLASAGNAILLSSYLSGTSEDGGSAVTIDASGNAWIAGYTTSLDFPVRGQPFQNTLHGSEAGFVSEVSAAGLLVYSSYFSAQPDLELSALAVDASGNVYLAGETDSSALPVTPGAYQMQYPGVPAAVVAKLSPTAGLSFCTYLGGAGGGSEANAIAVDAAGNIYVAGGTNSKNFPVSAGAYQGAINDILGLTLSADGFVTELNPSAQGTAQLVYSTFFGGSFDDNILSLALDPAGHVTILGDTNSVDFPVSPDAFQCCWSGIVEKSYLTIYGFLARLDLTKSKAAALVYSTLLGGTLYSNLDSLALDSTGNIAAVAGWVESTDTPVTPSAFQSVFGGEVPTTGYNTDLGDAYVARFDFSQSGPAATLFENGGGLAAIRGATIAPGLVFTIKGTGLGPAVYSLAELDPATGLIATKVQGVQVMVNGIPCALTYVSATQVNAIAPYELASKVGQTAQVQAYYNGVPGSLLTVNVTATAPGILSLDDGTGQGVILNSDGSLNGPNNPAAVGSTITIFGTGEGQTNPPGIDGGIANDLDHLPKPAAALSVSIGTVNAPDISYAGTAPEEVYGLLQVNVAIPAGVSPGPAVPVSLTVGGVSSQKGLTMAIK